MTIAMPRWKEHHYARAADFAQLIAGAIPSPPAPLFHAPTAAVPRPLAAPPTLKPAAPTAASVFKAIPWKK